jgi:hypothetical protein
MVCFGARRAREIARSLRSLSLLPRDGLVESSLISYRFGNDRTGRTVHFLVDGSWVRRVSSGTLMRVSMPLAALVFLVSAFGMRPAFADTRLLYTKLLRVKAPASGSAGRKIVWLVKLPLSVQLVTGDPTASGATLRVALSPGGDQCFHLPAANWTPIGTIGFKYRDGDLSEGAVKFAKIRRSQSGTFFMRVVVSGGGSETIVVQPGNPTMSYGVDLKIGGGDAYCSGTGSGVGTATPNPNSAYLFTVRNDTTPASCPIAACSPSGAFLEESAPLF